MNSEFTRAPEQTCETCLYWAEVSRADSDGRYCRRYPPHWTYQNIDDTYDDRGRPLSYDGFPTMFAREWCGEWRSAKDGAPAPRG